MNGERITIKLPEPAFEGKFSVESALLARRSIRSYKDAHLGLDQVSQLLWAAQGINRRSPFRTCPSAGALYPLEALLVAGKVEGMAAGIYRYDTGKHMLVQMGTQDVRRRLSEASLGQSMPAHAPATIAICAVYGRTTGKYGQRGIRYVHMEVGHAAQNIHLQAAALNLGTVVVGAFHDEKVKDILGLEADEEPLALMPVGK